MSINGSLCYLQKMDVSFWDKVSSEGSLWETERLLQPAVREVVAARTLH